MPAALGVMMNLLPPEKYRVHLHTAWQDEHAPEVTGLEAKAKLALHQHAEAFAHLRRDETCPICLEALPLANASTKTLPCEESVGGVDVVDSTHADVSTTHAAGERFRDDDTSVDTLVEEEEKADTPTSAAKAEGNLIADASTPPSQESDSASPPKRSSLTMTSYSSVSHDNNGNKSIDSAVGFVTLPCGHAFHTGCCSEWFARSTKCPSCRLVLTTAHVDGAAARLKCLLLEQKNCSKSPSSSSSSTAFPSALDVPLMQEKLELETDLCVPCGPGASPPLLGAHNNSSTEAAGPVLEGSNAASAGIVKVPICNLDSNYENRHVDFADDPIDDSSIDDDGSTSGVGVLSGVSACGKDLAWLVAETVKAGAEAEAAARKGASSSNSAEAEEESDLEEVDEEEEAQAGWRRITWSSLMPLSPSRALNRNPTSPSSARRALPPMTPNSAPPAYARAASAPISEPRPSLFRRARNAAAQIRPSLSFEIRDPAPPPGNNGGAGMSVAAGDDLVATAGARQEAWAEAAMPRAASVDATSQPAAQLSQRTSYRARFLATVRGR